MFRLRGLPFVRACVWLLLAAVVGALSIGLVYGNPVPAPSAAGWSGDFAVMMIMMWPFVPMFLIQVHFFRGFWRRLGLWTYLAIFLEWLPVGLVLFALGDLLLRFEVAVSAPIVVLGVVAVAAGVALHGWTLKLLGLKATIGYTELKPESESGKRTVITAGPFGVVRHPSYWAHTLIFSGVFLVTGVVAVGVIALVDFVLAYFVTTELEERELIERFGEEYRRYRRVPKFFPKLHREQV